MIDQEKSGEVGHVEGDLEEDLVAPELEELGIGEDGHG